MEIVPENQDQETRPDSTQEQDKDNEELAKEIPTVTPDTENLEPGPEEGDDE
ncbi:hypothetical protein [Mucilaginibacter arboris]|uniref:Uncharacterized protein n=1 Tax=Mucilaginibacter arboris TaxID=2682090 RepID=A0A7K1SW76_9SPHI|nr:hypothetical protein [Mucilaginibacter arboris]MVN21543.1 hypothetical protein [Mucilaginibacter arboris]